MVIGTAVLGEVQSRCGIVLLPPMMKFQQLTSLDANCHRLFNSPLIMSMWVLAYLSCSISQKHNTVFENA